MTSSPHNNVNSDRSEVSSLEQSAEKVEQQSIPQITLTRGPRRILYLILATITFLLGVIGAALPGLPTTPFLLLTSYFLVRSSPRFNNALLNSRFFGPILKEWQTKNSIQRHIKVKAITAVVIAVTLSVYLSAANPLHTIPVLLLAAIGVWVILRLPTS